MAISGGEDREEAASTAVENVVEVPTVVTEQVTLSGIFEFAQIDWLSIGVSAAIGVFLTIVYQWVSRAARTLFSKGRIPKEIRKSLMGEWSHYYYNVDSKGKVQFFDKENWEIKESILGNVKIEVYNGFDKSKYSGDIEFENGYLLMTLKSKNGDEKLFLRSSSDDITKKKGVHPELITFGSARDFKDRASVNATVLTKFELSEESFREIISKKVDVMVDERLMILKKD